METRVSGAKKEVIISDKRPTVLIGERINPTGKPKLAAALQAGDLEIVRQEAINQVKAGADILDVNVGSATVDEVGLLPKAVKAVMEVVNIPLCLDSANEKALEAAIKVYKGKALLSSVTGQEVSLKVMLPLVKEYKTAVVGLTMDDSGIPTDAAKRVAIAYKIINEAAKLGIPKEDIIIDCLAMTVGADNRAGLATIEAIRKVKADLGVNQTLGASNVSFGLPDRGLINTTFLAIAIAAGVNCPIVDAAKALLVIRATDLILGRDQYSMRYIEAYRQRQKQQQA
jgi:5-methyltetrahydrofolate--homocysteine methyltransferase